MRAHIAAAVVVAFTIVGCTTLFTKPVSSKVAAACAHLPAVAQSACRESGDAIAKSYVLLTAINTTIMDNVKSEVWTREQGREYLVKSIDAREKLDRVYDVFTKGDYGTALSQANITNLLIVALQKEIAAQSRKAS